MFGGIGDNEWELRLGVDQVFWGVVESQRLVDIINQVDFVEHPDGTAKLGQPMAHATLSGDWGVLELFGLPYHRARTFSGRRGRLRLPLVIDDDRDRDAPPSRSPGTFENELFTAARLAFNDIQSTEMTASFIGDLGRATHSLALGLDRRLSDSWSLHLEAVVLLGIDREDIHYYARRDSFIELALSYNFLITV